MTRNVQDFDLCPPTTKNRPRGAARQFISLTIVLLSVPNVWIYIRLALFLHIF